MARVSCRPASVNYRANRVKEDSGSPEKLHISLTDRSKSAVRQPTYLQLATSLNTLRAGNARKQALLVALQAETDTQISSDENMHARFRSLEETVAIKEAAVTEATTQQAQLRYILHRTRVEAENFQQRLSGLERERAKLESLVKPIELDLTKAQRKSLEIVKQAEEFRASTETNSANRSAKLEELQSKRVRLVSKTGWLMASCTARESSKQVTAT